MTQGQPVLTVGLPFFNEERWLALAIRSVLNQTMGDFELLLVNDGSTDRSLEIAQSFSDKRIRILSDGSRRHLAARLNEVTCEARGRFVARMDADDIAHPARFSRQLDVLEADRGLDAVGCWTILIDRLERAVAVVEARSSPITGRMALTRGVMPHPTLIARREWMRRHPYDVSLTRTEDRDFWCRIAASTRFAIVDQALYLQRVLADAPDFLAKYIEGQRQNRQLFLRHGPRMMGLRATARAWASAHAKALVMAGAVRLDFADRLVSRRGRAPTAEERALAAAAFAAARSAAAA